ncbi:MAG: U32 family peptidase [Bacteroidales bacterium]|nr:U32 family peptidase [Bacteroidales bacterium]MBN2818319.1 U32 family peptidase [Bacteroidales bacterium]
MNIIAGISNVNSPELIRSYAEAGVDEFFIGYIADSWSQNYGWEVSCNRREYANCNYLSVEEIENLVSIIHNNNRKVLLTLNAHEYNNEQIKQLFRMLDDIKHIPFDAFIVSNFALMLEIRKAGIETPINISIGSGANTYEAINFYTTNIENIGRVVLPRKLTFNEMTKIAEKAVKNGIKLEVFGLTDACFFNDEYCFSWHGILNKSFCNSPMYKNRITNSRLFDANWKQTISKTPIELYYNKKIQVEQEIQKLKTKLSFERTVPPIGNEEMSKLHILNVIGKCGLCAIQKLKELGVDAVKVPLRGFMSTQANIEVIKLVKTIVEEPDATPEFCQKALNSPNFCSGNNCFYNYPHSN